MKTRTFPLTILLLCTFLPVAGLQAQVTKGKFQPSHSVLLCDNGTVWTCGGNWHGQLGDGTTIGRTTPVQVTGLFNVVAVTTGEDHTMALKNDWMVWTWGRNDYGQLGDGTTTDRTTPVQVSGLTNIVAIAGGGYHSMALRNDGTVWTWGINYSITPLQVTGLTNIIAIAAGNGHFMALRNDGSVWTWGSNSSTPVQVTGLTNITAIAAGGTHSTALRNDGTVWAWGNNFYGQLGDGTTTNRTTPVQVTGLSNSTAIAAGWDHSIALRNDGTVWTWGANGNGQLGDGTTTGKTIPIQVTGLSNITAAIATGFWHTIAIRNDGTAWSWGGNWAGQLGDGTLTQRTTPVQMQLSCIVTPNITECEDNLVTGNVFYDLNANCIIDTSEQGLSFWMVKAEPGPAYAFTDNSGNYRFCLDSGNYTVSLMNINNDPFRDQVCPVAPTTYSVALGAGPDTVDNINFGLQATVLCPDLSVDISTWAIRPCFTSSYSVMYCNNGTAAAANATIEVELNDSMTYSGGTGSLISQTGNILTFDVGTVNPGQCGSFYFTAYITCDMSLLGSTMCVEAHIYPDSSCFPPDPTWDKSSVAVEGSCVSDSLACFTIYNTDDPGSGDMVGTSVYRIYENNVLVYSGNFQLAGGDSLVVCWLANGNTIRLEADQRPGHPGNSHPQDNVELCGGPPNITGQITLIPEDDENDFVETDCHVVTGSYDPNDKQVKPEGLIDTIHYIDSTDVLEYLIRFQNTGTDTAFKVVIRDTLSPTLNITTIRPGASSHPYSLDILGSDVLQWTFDNILLPDSNVNEPQSHGFVKFKIHQKAGNTMGTVIENNAGIIFDFNEPVITNTVFNTIGNVDSITGDTILSASIVLSKNTCVSNCEGAATVTAVKGASPYTYLWDDTLMQTTAAADSLCAGTYTVTIIDAYNDTAYAAITINVESPPIATIIPSGTITVCGSVTLYAGPGDSYLWSTGETTQSIVVTTSDSISVTVYNFCGDSVTSAITVVNVNPIPPTPAITYDGTTLASDAATGNQWYLDNNSIPGANGQVYTPTQSGNYTAIVTDSVTGCTSLTSNVQVISGINKISSGKMFNIYPNPTTGELNLQTPLLLGGAGGGIQIKIFNLFGQLIYAKNLNLKGGVNLSIDLSKYAKGMYYVQIVTDRNILTKKVVYQ